MGIEHLRSLVKQSIYKAKVCALHLHSPACSFNKQLAGNLTLFGYLSNMAGVNSHALSIRTLLSLEMWNYCQLTHGGHGRVLRLSLVPQLQPDFENNYFPRNTA